MDSSVSVNENGSYFTEQLAKGKHDFDPFAVLGLFPDDIFLAQYGARKHCKRVVSRHVDESDGGAAKTTGPRVPLWAHVHMAHELLFGADVSSDLFESRRMQWAPRSTQVWNPYAEPGSTAAKLPLTSRDGTSASSPCGCYWILTRVLHAVPLSYYTADPNDAPPPNASKDDGMELWEGNDHEDNDDENEDDDDGDNDSVQEVPGPPPTTPQARRRRQPATSPPATPSPRTPRQSAARLRQHDPPAGIYVGTWKGSGLSARRVALGLVNTVYMSVDKRGFVRRRITKWDRHGEEVMGSNWDGSSISCPHEDIKYVQRFKGMSKEQVDEEVRGIHARALARHNQAAL